MSRCQNIRESEALVAQIERTVRRACSWGLPGPLARHREDASQQAMLKLCGMLSLPSDSAELDRVVYRVIDNICRVIRRREQQEPLGLGEFLPETAEPVSTDPGTPLLKVEEADIVRWALGLLPKKIRHVLELVYFDDKTYREAADKLGVTEGSIRGSLRQGKRLLKPVLRARGLGTLVLAILTAPGRGAKAATAMAALMMRGTARAVLTLLSRAWAAGGLLAPALMLGTTLVVCLSLALRDDPGTAVRTVAPGPAPAAVRIAIAPRVVPTLIKVFGSGGPGPVRHVHFARVNSAGAIFFCAERSKDGRESDLRLMSWGDGSGMPTSGNSLVVVGADNNGLLHIRIFDSGGKRVTDADETQLPAQAAAIAALKQRLPGLMPPHVLTEAEKDRVIGEATSIVGQTHGRHTLFSCVPGGQPVEIDGADALPGEPHLIGVGEGGELLVRPSPAGRETDWSLGYYLLKDGRPVRVISPKQYTGLNTIGEPVLDPIVRHVFFKSDFEITVISLKDGSVTVVAKQGPGGRFEDLGEPVVGAGGEVVFSAQEYGQPCSIYRFRRGQVEDLLRVGGPKFKSIFGVKAADREGNLAFDATTLDGKDGVFIAGGDGEARAVVLAGDVFKEVHPEIFTDAGMLVFYGEPIEGSPGYFSGLDPKKDKIVQIGEALDGSIVKELAVSGFDGKSGRLLYHATLADGREGLYLAPIPGP